MNLLDLVRRRPAPSRPEPEPAPAFATADFVETAFQRVLRRAPSAEELAHYVAVTDHRGHAAVLELLFDSNEYKHRNAVDDRSEFYAGHYYSPVVDPEALRASGFRVDHLADEATVAGIDFRTAEMEAFWRRNLAVMTATGFPAKPTPGARYYTDNVLYAAGDAAILTAMLHEARPRRIVEVGSGFSSACMLDLADRLDLPTRFTFIEPYAERLRSLLRDGDAQRCAIVEAFVQQADLALFDDLAAGDILFIDSTHVSKAGSDVNHELFHVLPRLKPGVMVHFHDIFHPFEYPETWTFEYRRSWNEAYLLRAFLTGNAGWEMVFFNDFFRARRPELAAQLPQFAENPGGGLWLRKA